MKLSRTVITRHPMSRPMGAPGNAARHADVVRSALGLLETATQPGTILELEEFYQLPTPA
ncbi:MAG: hypothetical protein IIB28_06150 [Chloroflexi bacterium]|nr:hypothetical protein [Chloroflexota bacterium]